MSDVLQWIAGYYVGEGISNPEKIRDKIDAGRGPVSVYLLTLSSNPSRLMELVPAILLRQRHMYDSCQTVIGVASDKDEAMLLAARIFEETYQSTGDFRVEEYLKNR